MNPQHKHGRSRWNGKMVMFGVLIMGLCITGYVAGPPLYWHLSQTISSSAHYSCPSCPCDCATRPLLSFPQGVNVTSFTDCMEHDLGVSEEEERNFTASLAEELKQMENETTENQRRADMALLEAKKMVSQYQKEADKCTSGMGTCEEAREKAEIALEAQRQITAMWELRARHQGWKQDLV
ncbi:uncharacterized protein LOC107820204 [Nicotiana tabacum]|uniref:Uncharacterized protein LOC107820204 n=1 Tax=Nicotiana tabacum TaxID=4097 RepID=A0A1S4CLD1_TOBAC|nr:uncharacterized protein LOC104107371 [Nicotiana tomentosiformis]XP_016501920.1 PREDICTED: uncharacterized protein LOC107820204 [Nicotiana tabacum]